MTDEAAAHLVIGAAIRVHRALGPGFPEVVYEQAMTLELTALGVPFTRQASFDVRYRETVVGTGRVDLLVADVLVVELKAVERIAPVHTSQVIAYLRALGLHLGLVLNFNQSTQKEGLSRVAL